MALDGTYFSSSYYLTANVDVANNWSGTALSHYQAYGASENRAPNSWFNAQYYRANNTDLSTFTALQLFEHYEDFGYKEGRAPSSTYANFDEATYLSTYSDLGTGGITTSTALNHYLVFGINENRVAKNDDGTSVSSSTGSTYTLTSATDTFTGTANNDTFVADRINESGVANVTTLNSTDTLVGGSGTDTLTANYDDALSPTISGIETFTISDTGGVTFNFVNVTGVTDLNIMASTGNVDLNNIAAIPTTIDIINQAVNVDLDFAAAAVSGSADVLALSVSSVTAGNIVTDTGIESISIASNGSSANTMATLDTDGGGTAGATKLTLTGAIGLTITAALDTEITTIDASAATAATTLSVGVNLLTYTGGTGNDNLTISAGGLLYGTTTADTLNAGTGTDTLVAVEGDVDDAALTKAASSITNFEAFAFSDALAADTYYLDYLGSGIVTYNLAVDSAANAVLRVNSASKLDAAAGIEHTGTLTVSTTGSATTDTLTVEMDDPAGATWGALTFTTFETVTINSIDSANAGATNATGAITFGTTAATEKLVVTGSEALTVGIVTADNIDASAFTGVLTMVTGNVAAGGMQVTGGSGADTLFGVAASSDILDGGAGADTINFTMHATVADRMTGGTGADTFVMATTASVTATEAVITDFTVADDNLDISITWVEGVTIFTTNWEDVDANSIAASDLTFGVVSADGASLSGTGADIVVLTGATYADSAAALTAIGAAGARTFTLGATLTADDGILLAYELTSGGVEIAGIASDASGATSAQFDGIEVIVTLLGLTSTTVQSANIDAIA